MNNIDAFSSVRWKNDKIVMLLIFCFVIGLLFTSSMIAGYPRKDSKGPYKSNMLNYASDYDISAIEFIKSKVQNNISKPFIVGDTYTNAAAVVKWGYLAKVLEGKSYSLLSYFRRGEGFNDNSIWRLALKQPFQFVHNIPNETGNLSEITYLVITNREPDLMRIASNYYSIIGPPVFKINNGVYVFELDDSIDYLNRIYSGKVIAGDDQVNNNFWRLSQIGQGNSSFSISDITYNGTQKQNSLLFKIQDGVYERATLSHKFNDAQSWYNDASLSFYLDGMASGGSFNIVFLSYSDKDFFSMRVKDLTNKPGYITMPLNSFDKHGEPSWSHIKELRIQFLGGWPRGEIYFDNFVLSTPVKETSR